MLSFRSSIPALRHMTVLKSETTEGNFREAPVPAEAAGMDASHSPGHVSTVVLLAAFLFERVEVNLDGSLQGGWDAHCRTGA